MSDSSYGSVYVEGVTYIDEREIAKRDAEIERLREGERAADAEIERLRGDISYLESQNSKTIHRAAVEIERLRGLLRELLDNNWLPDSWAGSNERLIRERVREALGDVPDAG
jgi:hypothetical protein